MSVEVIDSAKPSRRQLVAFTGDGDGGASITWCSAPMPSAMTRMTALALHLDNSMLLRCFEMIVHVGGDE